MGTGNVASYMLVFLPFAQARSYVRSLKLQTQDEWNAYCKSSQKPDDIPSNPDRTYLAEFESYGDWLGNGNISNRMRTYRPFTEARSFARTLGLKSSKQWKEYYRSGKKPPYIPSGPWRTYRGDYKSMADWLGTEYLPFCEARAFVQRLGLINHEDWLNYCRSGKKSKYIPSKPGQVYPTEYIGMKDCLGVADKWNSETLLKFLYYLQPQLRYLIKKDLVLILKRNGALNAFRKVLGGATPMRVLNDLMKNGGKDLERALREKVIIIAVLKRL